MAIQYNFSELAILVTGAGRGLGRSAAEKLASCGATVGLIDVDADNCNAVATGIRAAGGSAHSPISSYEAVGRYTRPVGGWLARYSVKVRVCTRSRRSPSRPPSSAT